MAELTEEAVEAIVEATDELVVNLTRVRLSFAALGAAAGLAAGTVAGYAIARIVMGQHLADRVNQAIEDELNMLRTHFEAKEQARIANDKPNLAEKVQELGYAPVIGEEQVEVDSVFEHDEPQPEPEDPWNQAIEMQNRGPIEPYVLHRDEFMVNDDEHEQVTLTYFAGDDVLSDERDTVIAEPDVIVGLDNLQKFGYGSEDPNTVYICNPRLEVDYEVVRSEGSFAQEVHGFSDGDLQHSERRRKRVRFDDDPRSV
jgi:hypothetical protein